MPGSFTKVNLLSKPLTVNLKLKDADRTRLLIEINFNEKYGLTAKSFLITLQSYYLQLFLAKHR
ncbi:MAG: hypothetical protein ACRDE5_10875, partial [Ginsengibacter sp.]